jgi:hypothetical protein
MKTLYDLCFDSMLSAPMNSVGIGSYKLATPVKVWDNLAKKERTITIYDSAGHMFSDAQGVWFMATDTHFSLEAATPAEATETTVVVAPPGPHKCTCNIVELIQVGCQCKGV